MMDMTQAPLTPPPKVLVTKIGFDGHDRGSRLIAAYLRDAGMEVVYTPPWQSIDAVVKIVLEEDIDVVGISSLASDHRIVPKLMDALGNAGVGDVAVVVGGIVPNGDVAGLMSAGVTRVFHPGTPMEEIIEVIRRATADGRQKRHGGDHHDDSVEKGTRE